MPVVCLPDAEAERLAGELPDDIRVVRWDGGEDEPDGLREVEFLVPLPDWFARDHPELILARLPRLQVIQTVSAGVDYILPLVPHGVTLCDARGVHGGAVSEWVLAAVLASLHELPRFVQARAEGDWRHDVITDELAGKRVLLIGAGDLGEHTARRLKPFDTDIVRSARQARDTDDGRVHGRDELADLLPDADIVVLLVPKTAETVGLVDAAFLARMPDGALLVNAARGPVVDTDALLEELTSGRLRAALDVTDPEPPPPGHPLWTAPNLLLTPHVAGNVPGFPRRAFALVREQILRYAGGLELANVVRGDY